MSFIKSVHINTIIIYYYYYGLGLFVYVISHFALPTQKV